MKKRNIVYTFILIWVLVCCSKSGKFTVSPPEKTRLPSLLTKVFTITPSITRSNIGKTISHTLTPPAPFHASTIMPTSTPTITHTPRTVASSTATVLAGSLLPQPDYETTQQCLVVEPYPTKNFNVEGKIIRYCLHENGICYLSFNDITAVEKSLVSMPGTSDLIASYPTVSPNGEWLAYLEVIRTTSGEIQNRRLQVVSSDGKLQSDRLLDFRWGIITNWLDNNRLVLIEPDVYTLRALIINPFTGQSQEIDPDMYLSEPYPYPGDSLIRQPLRFYNQALTQVVYAAEMDGNIAFVLLDIQTQKVLWIRLLWGNGLSYPEWSPDGKQVLIAAGKEEGDAELFSVDQFGNETQLTKLVEAYPDLYTHIESYHWSSNGQQVAFWYSTNETAAWGKIYHLAVLDVQTKQVIDYCLPYEYGEGGTFRDPYYVWSPSGDQLVTAYSWIVVDLIHKIAVDPVKDDGFLLGWMVNP